MQPQRGREPQAKSEMARLRSAIVAPARPSSEYLTRIPVRGGDGLVLVPTDRVMMITADRQRLIITTRDQQQHTILYRLKDLETRLDPAVFVRLSRSLIVNLNSITRIVNGPAGTSTALFENGRQVGMSRNQTGRLRRVFQDLLK